MKSIRIEISLDDVRVVVAEVNQERVAHVLALNTMGDVAGCASGGSSTLYDTESRRVAAAISDVWDRGMPAQKYVTYRVRTWPAFAEHRIALNVLRGGLA